MKKEHPIKCQLCHRENATKKNSHIIPSFIMCRMSSADGTGKRNHELTYSIGKIIKAYTGNEVPMEVMERNFEDLSDERISEELKKNDVSLDNIFCPSCEKALADYLESPYGSMIATGSNITGQEQYFFWMSVVWRVSRFDVLKCSLPKFISTELRKSLDEYLQLRKLNAKQLIIHEKYPFKYRILRCKDYSNNSSGCVFAEYDKNIKVFSMALGDLIICVSFGDSQLPPDYDFLGIGNVIKTATLNDGSSIEKIKDVEKEIFDIAYRNLINSARDYYLNNQWTLIVTFWKRCLKLGLPLPDTEPSDEFIKSCIQNIVDKDKKNGEKHTHKNFAVSFASALESVYGIHVPD